MRHQRTLGIVVVCGLGVWAMAHGLGSDASISKAQPLKLPEPMLGPEAPKPPPACPLPVVVIDPGHGGSNMGAPSVTKDIFEKHFTLSMAKHLATEMKKRDITPILTRENDVYLTLRQRTAHAETVRAKRFISIHANASTSHQPRGYETFVASPKAANIIAPALRIDGYSTRRDLSPYAKATLADAEQAKAAELSIPFAKSIQSALRKVRGPRGDRGVKQGEQHVLLGATMPSVLVEIGFIDHPVEGEDLLRDATQQDIAKSLADAVALELCGDVSSCEKLQCFD